MNGQLVISAFLLSLVLVAGMVSAATSTVVLTVEGMT
jgi:hypothetical protein